MRAVLSNGTTLIMKEEKGFAYADYIEASTKGGYSINLGICYNPMFNCQTLSLAGIGGFVSGLGYHKTELPEILSYLTRIDRRKRQVLLDVHSSDLVRVKKYFDKAVLVLESPYKSSNGSNMFILLYRVDVIPEIIL